MKTLDQDKFMDGNKHVHMGLWRVWSPQATIVNTTNVIEILLILVTDRSVLVELTQSNQ